MKVKEIINQLHYFQKWIRGSDVERPDPTEIGKAIDGAIRELRNFQRLKVKIEKKEKLHAEYRDFLKRFEQQPIDPEIQAAIMDHFWEMVEELPQGEK